MAIDAKVPILPISVRGAYELMPPGSFAIRPGCIEVVFHDPIPTTNYRHEDIERLMDDVRNRIASSLDNERKS